jgi:hypothetical protein
MSFLFLPDWMKLRRGQDLFGKGIIYATAAVLVSIDVALAGFFVYAVRVI